MIRCFKIISIILLSIYLESKSFYFDTNNLRFSNTLSKTNLKCICIQNTTLSELANGDFFTSWQDLRYAKVCILDLYLHVSQIAWLLISILPKKSFQNSFTITIRVSNIFIVSLLRFLHIGFSIIQLIMHNIIFNIKIGWIV